MSGARPLLSPPKAPLRLLRVEVENFENFIERGLSVTSSLFKIEDSQWMIQIEVNKQGFVSMYLKNYNSMTYEVEGSLTSCGVKKNFSNKTKISGISTSGWKEMVSHADCIKNLVNGNLYVKAEVAVVKDEIKRLHGIKSKVEVVAMKESDLSELVENILVNKVCSDLLLVSNGEEFGVHKSFIAGQSETLSDLDEYKPVVVKNLINYLYRKDMEWRLSTKTLSSF